MQPDFLPEQEGEKLDVENKCLRMKLMLESGAEFFSNDNGLPPDVENIFLQHIVEFENQFRNQRQTTIRERIGSTGRFKPADELSDDEVGKAWDELRELLNQSNISLSVCSPNVKPRELYSFALGEFMDIEVADVRMPGMLTCFIYDEFYPDPEYECQRTAEEIIRSVFLKSDFKSGYGLPMENIELNGELLSTRDEFYLRASKFRDLFEDLVLGDALCCKTQVNGDTGIVTGSYTLDAYLQTEEFRMAGTWEIELAYDQEMKMWDAKRITIRGIDFI